MRSSVFALFVVVAAVSCVKRVDDAAPPTAEQALAQAFANSLLDGGVPLSMDDSSTCGVCHSAIAAEFQQSMHSQAHHDADPLYAAMRDFRLRREGAALSHKCASCHSPRDVENVDSAIAKTGVSCATCHELAAVHLDAGMRGAAALERGPSGLLLGGYTLDAGASPLHQTGPALSALVDGTTVCLACHAEERNKAGLATCSTGVELSQAADARSCASCHMPKVEGPSGPVSTRRAHLSHAFVGPHRAWRGDTSLLASSLEIGGRFEGDHFIATLENRSGHSFPTGFPARMAVLVMRGLDATGNEVWRNVTNEPMKEHPVAVLNKVPARVTVRVRLLLLSITLVAEIDQVSTAESLVLIVMTLVA